MWLAMRSLSLETSLPLFDTIWAGAPRSLDMSQPSESCVTALLMLGDSDRDTHGQSLPRPAVVVASASSVRRLVSNSCSVDFIVLAHRERGLPRTDLLSQLDVADAIAKQSVGQAQATPVGVEE